jgi:hypothetical protein
MAPMDGSIGLGASVELAAESGGTGGVEPVTPVVPVATWDPTVYAVFAVDYDAGNDANPGFAIAASSSFADFQAAVAAAGKVAKKTMQGLGAVVPVAGAGRKIFIDIAARAGGASYLKQDGVTVDSLDSFMSGRDGYAEIDIWGTGTNATAGSTRFTGSVNDLTYAGAIPVTGTNVAGYNPTAAATPSTVPCLRVGGGAPGLAAEPAAPLGYSTRYDVATSTAALRNVCRNTSIVSTTTTANDTVSPQADWPAAPAAADVFYLEQPGVVCNGWGAAWGATNASIIICGLRALTLTSYVTGPIAIGRIRHMFTDLGGGTSFATSGTGILSISAIAPGVGAGTITRGSTIRSEGATIIQPGAIFPEMNSPVMVGNVLAEFQFGGVWAAGAVFGAGFTVQGGQCGAFLNNPVIGNVTAALQCRIIGPGGQAGLFVEGAIFNVKDVAITGMGAKPAIKVIGRSVLFIEGTSGATGNTDVGLDLTGAQGSTIVLNSGAPTVTGTTGDVRLAGGQIVSWASLNTTGIVDSAGNRIIGAAAPMQVVAKFSGTLQVSAGGATTTDLGDPGTQPLLNSNSSSNVEYATSARLISRMRVYWPIVNGATAVTVTLAQRPKATGVRADTTMTVNIPGGQAANTTLVDLAHPILFADGDTFAVHADSAAAPEGGGKSLTVTLEGPC